MPDTSAISTDRIVHLAGRLDPTTLAEVVRLAPTEEELVEALSWLDGEHGDEPVAHPSHARTMALFALLAEAFEDEDIEDEVTEPQ
jgi:hypothetical protein